MNRFVHPSGRCNGSPAESPGVVIFGPVLAASPQVSGLSQHNRDAPSHRGERNLTCSLDTDGLSHNLIRGRTLVRGIPPASHGLLGADEADHSRARPWSRIESPEINLSLMVRDRATKQARTHNGE